ARRIVDDFGPFALVGINQELQLPLQLVGDPQPVVNNDVAEIGDSPLHVRQPDARPCQPVGGGDVVHQEAVDVLDGRVFVQVGGEQIGVARLGPSVAADVKIVSLLSGDQPEVL